MLSLKYRLRKKIAELQQSPNQKYQAKAVSKAVLDSEEEEEKPKVKQTRAAARAKLDIAVEDDED